MSISDREGDFYNLFERAEQTPGIKADWPVRMKFINRATLDGNGKREQMLLHERIMQITPQQLGEFTIPEERGQSTRTVEQQTVVIPSTNAAVVVLPRPALQLIRVRKQRDKVPLKWNCGFLLTLFTRS